MIKNYSNNFSKSENSSRVVGDSAESPLLHKTRSFSFREANNNLNIGLVLNKISGSGEYKVEVIGSLLKIKKINKFKNKYPSDKVVSSLFNSSPDCNNIQVAKNDLKDKISGYFSSKKEWLKFITLTFDPKTNTNRDLYNPHDAHKCIRLFVKKLQDKYGLFRYIWVAERHKSGVIHYHMLAYIKYIPKDEFHSYWIYGRSRIEAPKLINNMHRYMTKMSFEMSKYLDKSKDNNSFAGHKRYASSKDVKKISIYENAFEIASKLLIQRDPDYSGRYYFHNDFMEGECYWFKFKDELT